MYWKVEASTVEDNDAHDTKLGGQKRRHDGRDQDGATGTDFTVSLKVPEGMSAQDFISKVKLHPTDGNRRVYFNLPIENDKQQIRISWGDANPNHRGNGGKPTTLSAA